MRKLAIPVLVTGLLSTALTLRAFVPATPPAEVIPLTAVTSHDTAPAVMSYEAQNEVIKQYCVGCHNDNMLTLLHKLGLEDLETFGDSTGEFAFTA